MNPTSKPSTPKWEGDFGTVFTWPGVRHARTRVPEARVMAKEQRQQDDEPATPRGEGLSPGRVDAGVRPPWVATARPLGCHGCSRAVAFDDVPHDTR